MHDTKPLATHGALQMGTTSDPLATPDFFPTRFDLDQERVLFVRMSRETYRLSPFLDRRTVRAGRQWLAAGMRALVSRKPQLPLHFVLHSAFCGSTLLARYLEQAPHCLVLKEPQVLGELVWTGEEHFAGKRYGWTDYFDATFALLARGYPEDIAVIVKAPDSSNWLGPQLLTKAQSTKIVFLFSPLKLFLIQVLKIGHRREWVKEHMKSIHRPFSQTPFLAGVDVARLTDGERAAAMWLMNSYLCSQLLERADPGRVLVFSGEKLISYPQESVAHIAEFLGIDSDPANRTALTNIRPSDRHAKDESLAYDATRRNVEIAEAAIALRSEVEAALEWAKTIASQWIHGSILPLDEPLPPAGLQGSTIA